jgi:FlaG/FlaF family flagellin (archaellin)
MKESRKKSFSVEDAVSPVVGVMLMLVVTIIIAAVVSGFAGGLASTTEKAPTISMEVEIANGGTWSNSHFSAFITGVEEGIPTGDLKLVTKWSAKNETGTLVSGGATVVPGETNTHLYYTLWGVPQGMAEDWWDTNAPQGYGPGVDPAAIVEYPYEPVNMDASPDWPSTPDSEGLNDGSWFGKYNLISGTAMYSEPFGSSREPNQIGASALDVGYGVVTPYEYTYGVGHKGATEMAQFFAPDDALYPSIDSMMAILGNNWYELRAGDVVDVKLVHIPSGKVIWQKDVVVEG